MGCINSKDDLSDISPNIYRVVNLNDDNVSLWSGQLEITPKELTLYRKGREPTRWSLQHLRRYGFTAETFTFEAGRRCTTGEGIYSFKCRRAESLFHTLQSYIHGIALTDENGHQMTDFVPGNSTLNGASGQSRNRTSSFWSRPGAFQSQSGNYVISSNRPNSASSNGGISMVNSELLSTDSNYLEPTPARNNIVVRNSSGLRLNSLGSGGPISPEANSPGSPNSFSILEVTQLNQQQNTYQNSNIYHELPLKSNENNNNLLIKKLSLDIPPQDPAPAVSLMHQNSLISENNFPSPGNQNSPNEFDASHMYVNVTPEELEGVLKSCTPITTMSSQINFSVPKSISKYSIDPTARCYENLDLGDIRSMPIQPRTSRPDIFTKIELPNYGGKCDKSEPVTPTSILEKKGVNYIILDLDQSSSSSTALVTNSIHNTGPIITAPGTSLSASTVHTQNSSININNNVIKQVSTTNMSGHNLLTPESPKNSNLGYATIDFNKTVALSNTTAALEMDIEGSRKTRHSSTITRHSNSVSD